MIKQKNTFALDLHDKEFSITVEQDASLAEMFEALTLFRNAVMEKMRDPIPEDAKKED